MIKEDGKDKIVPRAAFNKELPPVFMEIYQVKDKDPGTVLKQLELQLKTKYSKVNYIGKVQQPLKDLLITASSGNKWNDIIEHYYLVDNTQKGSFIIKQHYFLEASEGHGARFYHMLQEFRLVTP